MGVDKLMNDVGEHIWAILFARPRPVRGVEYGPTLLTRVAMKDILHNPSFYARATKLEVIHHLAEGDTLEDFRGLACRTPLGGWTLKDGINRQRLRAACDSLFGDTLQPRA